LFTFAHARKPLQLNPARSFSSRTGKAVKVYDLATGKELFSFPVPKVSSPLTFSQDGKRLAGSGGPLVSPNSLPFEMKIWDATTGKEMLSLPGHERQLCFGQALALSPDCRRLAIGDRDVTVWDATTGKRLRTLRGHSNFVWWLTFGPSDDRLISGSDDRTVKVWDLTSGEELLTLRGHGAGISALAFSTDGQRLASASSDGTVKIWDGTPWQEPERHARGGTNPAIDAALRRLQSDLRRGEAMAR
jgi:WD40 repeat protein